MRKAITIFSIEGNIGSGKTTLLQILKKRIKHLSIIKEPVDDWQKISLYGKNYNLLEKYYQQPFRWAYTFQINAILTRMSILHQTITNNLQNNSDKILFSQRSITADKQIFAKLLFQQKKMSNMEFALYLKMYNQLDNLFKTPKIHKYIYLKSSPQKCLQRIATRGRASQKQSIKLQYLQKIHKMHENWLMSEQQCQKRNVLTVINGNQQFEDNEQLTQIYVNNIFQQIKQSQKKALIINGF